MRLNHTKFNPIFLQLQTDENFHQGVANLTYEIWRFYTTSSIDQTRSLVYYTVALSYGKSSSRFAENLWQVWPRKRDCKSYYIFSIVLNHIAWGWIQAENSLEVMHIKSKALALSVSWSCTCLRGSLLSCSDCSHIYLLLYIVLSRCKLQVMFLQVSKVFQAKSEHA